MCKWNPLWPSQRHRDNPFPPNPFAGSTTPGRPDSQEFETDPQVDDVGRVRVPIAGPYRPWARVVPTPDLRLVWIVRLGTVIGRSGGSPPSRALEFARLNHLPTVAFGSGYSTDGGRSDA